MTFLVFDFSAIDAICYRMRRGVRLTSHDWDYVTDKCNKCLLSRIEIEDGFGPDVCNGKPFEPGTVLYENWWSVLVMLSEPFGRYLLDKRRDVPRQQREIFGMIGKEIAFWPYVDPPHPSPYMNPNVYLRGQA